MSRSRVGAMRNPGYTTLRLAQDLVLTTHSRLCASSARPRRVISCLGQRSRADASSAERRSPLCCTPWPVAGFAVTRSRRRDPYYCPTGCPVATAPAPFICRRRTFSLRPRSTRTPAAGRVGDGVRRHNAVIVHERLGFLAWTHPLSALTLCYSVPETSFG